MVFYFLVTLSVPSLDPDELREPVGNGITPLSETIRQRLAGVRLADDQEWKARHVMQGADGGPEYESGLLNAMARWLRKMPQHIVVVSFCLFLLVFYAGFAFGTLWKH